MKIDNCKGQLTISGVSFSFEISDGVLSMVSRAALPDAFSLVRALEDQSVAGVPSPPRASWGDTTVKAEPKGDFRSAFVGQPKAEKATEVTAPDALPSAPEQPKVEKVAELPSAPEQPRVPKAARKAVAVALPPAPEAIQAAAQEQKPENPWTRASTKLAEKADLPAESTVRVEDISGPPAAPDKPDEATFLEVCKVHGLDPEVFRAKPRALDAFSYLQRSPSIAAMTDDGFAQVAVTCAPHVQGLHRIANVEERAKSWLAAYREEQQ